MLCALSYRFVELDRPRSWMLKGQPRSRSSLCIPRLRRGRVAEEGRVFVEEEVPPTAPSARRRLSAACKCRGMPDSTYTAGHRSGSLESTPSARGREFGPALLQHVAGLSSSARQSARAARWSTRVPHTTATGTWLEQGIRAKSATRRADERTRSSLSPGGVVEALFHWFTRGTDHLPELQRDDRPEEGAPRPPLCDRGIGKHEPHGAKRVPELSNIRLPFTEDNLGQRTATDRSVRLLHGLKP